MNIFQKNKRLLENLWDLKGFLMKNHESFIRKYLHTNHPHDHTNILDLPYHIKYDFYPDDEGLSSIEFHESCGISDLFINFDCDYFDISFISVDGIYFIRSTSIGSVFTKHINRVHFDPEEDKGFDWTDEDLTLIKMSL